MFVAFSLKLVSINCVCSCIWSPGSGRQEGLGCSKVLVCLAARFWLTTGKVFGSLSEKDLDPTVGSVGDAE